MLTKDFDFHLPAGSVAQRAAPRGTSKLMVLDAIGAGRHRSVADLPEILRPGDLLVVNDTRVIPARLFARRASTQSQVELLLVERHGPTEWDVLAKPGKRARVGERLLLGDEGAQAMLEAEVIAKAADGRHRVRFSEPVEPHLETLGHVPLPPYIHRQDDPADRARSPTAFPRFQGSVAARPPVCTSLRDPRHGAPAGSRSARSLSMSASDVQTGDRRARSRARDGERALEISAGRRGHRANSRRGRRIVAVGTTVVRTLEAAALATGEVSPAAGRTNIFITPGFRFRTVDVLLTNFHLPQSTLLMLVSAFAGRERVLAAYEEAIRTGYRFYSYGDAMLVERV